MTSTEINQEIIKTKTIKDKLLACVKAGQFEYYKEYIETSSYYLKLMQLKPNHDFTLA
jgi:hypothetical protein